MLSIFNFYKKKKFVLAEVIQRLQFFRKIM